jgi:hypothetical protein
MCGLDAFSRWDRAREGGRAGINTTRSFLEEGRADGWVLMSNTRTARATYNYVHGGWDKGQKAKNDKRTEKDKTGWGLFIGIRHFVSLGCLGTWGGKSVAAAQR